MEFNFLRPQVVKGFRVVSVSKNLLRKGVENSYKNINLSGRLIHAPKIKKAGVLQKPTFSHETKIYLIRSILIISFFKRSYGV